jgi:hypothetical protein
MAIQAPKKKQGSNHPEMINVIRNLVKQLSPKKSSATTRIQGALIQKANAFIADSAAVKQAEASNKIRIHLSGTELTVSERN